MDHSYYQAVPGRQDDVQVRRRPQLEAVSFIDQTNAERLNRALCLSSLLVLSSLASIIAEFCELLINLGGDLKVDDDFRLRTQHPFAGSGNHSAPIFGDLLRAQPPKQLSFSLAPPHFNLVWLWRENSKVLKRSLWLVGLFLLFKSSRRCS